jgi:UDP-N-acetylmuramyl pentapeptide phosphotransferase/UDP-N-acetylglucosamine-1-phosphate transferase
VFALALGFGLALTCAAIPLAGRFGLTDRPDGRRKVQRAAVPVVGGTHPLGPTLLAVAELADELERLMIDIVAPADSVTHPDAETVAAV